MKAALILGNVCNILDEYLKDRVLIGVDKGAYLAYTKGIHLDIAIGDFDSISEAMLECVYKNSDRVIRLNPVKDLTDTAEAIALCRDYSDILIIGGIEGKRIEHFLANLILLKNDKRISMVDDNSKIETHEESFIPASSYKYLSFFSVEKESIITLKGFKYELNSYILKDNDALCISNEIVTNPEVVIRKGRILAIYSNNDHEKI